MDALLQRYLDGDLTPQDAATFEARLAAEPALAAQLQAWERTLAELAAPPAAQVSARFADRVMAGVHATDALALGPRTRRRSAVTRTRFLAMAASLVFCFLAGYLVAERGIAGRHPRSQAESAVATVRLASEQDRASLRVARLVFPEAVTAHTVTVAGDFNNWQPDGLPLVQRHGIWTIDLALPPGIYEYMFVVDGQQWVTDPLARTTRDDGYGGANAILDLTI